MKILTVFTGGTIGSSRQGNSIAPDEKNTFLLLQMYHEQYGAAAFETVAPYTILSENLNAKRLKALRACITEQLTKGYDGIIVTHGTDTLQYAAAYLDLVLGETDTPVVLVSANYPLEDGRSNGLKNFAAAVDFIRSGSEKGVFVAYQNTGSDGASIHRGSRLLPHLPYDDGVHSLFFQPFGTIQNGVFVKNPDYREGEREDFSDCELNGTVLFVTPYVGITYPVVEESIKAVLLQGWHSGTLPTDSEALAAFCQTAKERGVPVYLTGSQDGFEYATKQAFETLGIQVLPPMSPIAAYVRLWLR